MAKVMFVKMKTVKDYTINTKVIWIIYKLLNYKCFCIISNLFSEFEIRIQQPKHVCAR